MIERQAPNDDRAAISFKTGKRDASILPEAIIE